MLKKYTKIVLNGLRINDIIHHPAAISYILCLVIGFMTEAIALITKPEDDDYIHMLCLFLMIAVVIVGHYLEFLKIYRSDANIPCRSLIYVGLIAYCLILILVELLLLCLF